MGQPPHPPLTFNHEGDKLQQSAFKNKKQNRRIYFSGLVLCQPQSKELGFGDFQSWLELLGQDLGTVGTGDSDLGLGLTIKYDYTVTQFRALVSF